MWRNPWGEEGGEEVGMEGKQVMELQLEAGVDFMGKVSSFLNGCKQLYFLLCHPHCLLGSWISFSFTFSTQNHLIFAQLDPLGHIQTTRLIQPKMSMSHSIQRRRTRDETALHLPAPLHPSTYPLPSLWLLTPLWGWREKEKGHSRSGGAGTVSPARGFLRRGGWVFKHRLCRGDPSRPHRSPGRWFSALRQPAFQTPLTWPTPRASRNAECGHPGDLQSHR